MPAKADVIPIVAGASTLPSPPTSWAHVEHWGGITNLLFDTELWADAAVAGTVLELLGAVGKTVTIADDDVDSVDTGTDKLTLTGHGLQSGDGPIQLTTTGTLPGGLSLATDYWVEVVDVNDIKLHTTLSSVLAKTAAVDLTAGEAGTHTIADTSSTERLRWMSHGLLGNAVDGVVALDVHLGYALRAAHRPPTLAYALVGTVDAATNADVRLIRPAS